MTKEDIKDAVKEGVKEELGSLYIEREQHFLDHQLVKGVRKGISTGKKAGIWTLGATLVVSVLGAVGWGIKEFIKQVLRGG